MSKTTITQEELEVPLGALIEVAAILIENGISNEIIDTDEDEDSITLEVNYSKDEREIIHQVKNIISDYEEDDDDDEEQN